MQKTSEKSTNKFIVKFCNLMIRTFNVILPYWFYESIILLDKLYVGVSINSESGNYSNHCLFFWTTSKDDFKTNQIVYKNTYSYLRFLVCLSQVFTHHFCESYVLRYFYEIQVSLLIRGRYVPWTVNLEFADKKAGFDWHFVICRFWLFADKKSAINEDRLYRKYSRISRNFWQKMTKIKKNSI